MVLQKRMEKCIILNWKLMRLVGLPQLGTLVCTHTEQLPTILRRKQLKLRQTGQTGDVFRCSDKLRGCMSLKSQYGSP
jgi:hypothetical protein